MKEIFKKSLSMIMCVVMVFTIFKGTTLSSSAKVIGPDGKTELTITTDKERYSWDSDIYFTINVKNITDETLKGIRINSSSRQFSKIVQQGDLPIIDELKPGESKSVQIQYYATRTIWIVAIFLPIITLVHSLMSMSYNRDSFNYEEKVKIGAFKYKVGFKTEYDVPTDNIGQIYSRDFSADDIVTTSDGQMEYIRNELLLVANESAYFDDIKSLVKESGGEIVGYIEITGDYQIAFKNKSEADLNTFIDTLKSSPLIDNSMLNYVIPISSDAVSVSDGWAGDDWSESAPEGRNWGLEAIYAREAWEYADQMSNINIGIIDNGFDTSHEELNDVIVWTEDNHIESQSNSEYPGHGTHVLGTFAALTNNGAGTNNGGISGVFPNRINNNQPKAFAYCIDNIGQPNNRNSSLIAIKEALVKLIVRNVKVINISESLGDEYAATFAASIGNEDAIKFFKEWSDPLGDLLHRLLGLGYDFVICQSAGNNSSTNLLNAHECYIKDSSSEFGWKRDSSASWNAYYGKMDAKYNNVFTAIDNHQDVIDRIIVVGAIENKGVSKKGVHRGYSVASFSNWGDRVDVLAPGVSIYSANISGYDSIDGTSQATPHVSGTAAMVWASNTNLKGNEVKSIICNTTSTQITDTFPGADPVFHYDDSHQTNGLIDAQAAVEEAINRKSPNYTPDFKEKNTCAINIKVNDSITGSVPIGEDGKVISDILVTAYPTNGQTVGTIPAATATSDIDGDVYMLTNPGSYLLRVEIPGYLPAEERIVTIANSVTQIAIDVCKSGGLSYEMRESYFEHMTSNGKLFSTNKVEYPYFLGKTTLESDLNSHFKTIINAYKTFDGNIDEYYNDVVEVNQTHKLPFYENTIAYVTYNQNNYISIEEYTVDWSGGGHPYTYPSAKTFSIKTGKEQNYSDFFIGSRTNISNIIKSAFREQIGYIPTSYGSFEDLLDETPFSLKENGICFHYYAGGAVPNVEVIVPFTEGMEPFIEV